MKELYCENCGCRISGYGRYYPGSTNPPQPMMRHICEPCETQLIGETLKAIPEAHRADKPAA